MAAAARTLWVLLVCVTGCPQPGWTEGEVTLRYRLRPGDRFAFARAATIAGTFRLSHGGPRAGGQTPETTLQVRARVWAASAQEVASRLPDGAYRVIEKHALRVEVGGLPLPIPAFGPSETRLSPLGVRQAVGAGALSDLLPFGLGIPDLLPGAVLQFPPEPVRVGARWQTRAQWMLPSRQEASTTATAHLSGIEGIEGQRCVRITTEAEIPPFALTTGQEEGGGLLRVRGIASGEALHALATGVPLLSRMRIRLWLEAEGVGAVGEAPPSGVGEVTIDLDCRQIPAGGRVQPPERSSAPSWSPDPRPQARAKRTGPTRKPSGSTPAQALRILQPLSHQPVTHDLVVECQVTDPQARYALIQVDGTARAAINAPYRYRLGMEGIAPGEHVLEVTLYAADGIVLATARRRFRLAPSP